MHQAVITCAINLCIFINTLQDLLHLAKLQRCQDLLNHKSSRSFIIFIIPYLPTHHTTTYIHNIKVVTMNVYANFKIKNETHNHLLHIVFKWAMLSTKHLLIWIQTAMNVKAQFGSMET